MSHHIPDDLSPFYKCEQAYRRLWFKMKEEKIAVTDPVI